MIDRAATIKCATSLALDATSPWLEARAKRKNLRHLVGGQHKIEYGQVFRQPLKT
jgi:hypothetical protein